MNKAILLDFDGVILKQCAAHDHVQRRCQMYTQKKIKDASPELSNHLYKTYGHTVLGINAVKKSRVAAKDEFDTFVYSNIDVSWFRDLKTRDHQKHLKQVMKLINKCVAVDVPIYIFSNAPVSWCDSAMLAMDPSGDLLRYMTQIDNGMLLKPEADIYNKVSSLLKVDKICFVDDNLINFTNIMNNNMWKKVWYCEDAQSVFNINDDCFVTNHNFEGL
jgi:FMN phosphatase YigB (HAD superfamily)